MTLSSQHDEYFELAKDVFIEFARFEYCLKITGFLKTADGKAEPDWDKFSNCNEMRELFKEIRANNGAPCDKMHYILKNPPKQQVVKDGVLSWNDPKPIHSSQDYFGAVRRIRNNLFHGGKFNGEFFEPERSAELLEALLCVLKCSIERHSEIAEAYGQKSD